MRVGILGCGYIGKATALQWKAEGAHVAVTTRQQERIEELSLIADQVYCLSEESLSSFMSSLDILIISVAPDSVADYISTYLETAKAVASRVQASPHLHQIIYTSSVSLYGNVNGAWVDEEHPIICHDGNRKILYDAEQTLLQCASPELRVCILRLGEIYGPSREIETKLRHRHTLPFAGTGESYTNIIHRDDIVKAILFAAEHHLQGIFNLCSDFHMKRNEFYNAVCQKEGIPPIQWDPSRESPHGGSRRVSNAKIKNAGFQFFHPSFF